MRFTLELPLDMSKEDIEKTVIAHEKTQAQLAGRTPKKIIIVPGKIINIVGYTFNAFKYKKAVVIYLQQLFL